MLTARQIDLVQKTFAQLEAHGPLFSRAFYARMFEHNPNIRHLFKGDEDSQAARFMEMIGTLVAGLARMEQLKPAVRHLGLRHVHYGVRPSDYPIFGEALIWTLERFLGEAFNRETREAWTAFYDTLVDLMGGMGDRATGVVPANHLAPHIKAAATQPADGKNGSK